MPKFNYEAFDKSSRVRRGEIGARSKEEAIQALREGVVDGVPLFVQNIEEDGVPLKTVLPCEDAREAPRPAPQPEAKEPRPEPAAPAKPKAPSRDVTIEELLDVADRVVAMPRPSGFAQNVGPALATWNLAQAQLAQGAYYLAMAMAAAEGVKLQERKKT